MSKNVPIPVMAGVYVDDKPDVRVALPYNMVPVPGQEGVADGYLRQADGISLLGTGPGVDRGGHVWDGVHYRVMGTRLVSVSATGMVTDIGDVGGTGPVRLANSFDRLGIVSNGFLWLYDGATLLKVTNVNIPANLIDGVWIDGYWIVTDGEDMAASTLADPEIFNADSYSGTDRPDPIKALLKINNELHVVSRSFIDVFQNSGDSTGFPFKRVNGAVITKGALGTRTACVFNNTVALLGCGTSAGNPDQKEVPSVYAAANASTVRIASMEVDRTLAGYTEDELADAFVEAVIDIGCELLFIHLPDRTLVYDAIASAKSQYPVWHVRGSGLDDFSRYRAHYITRAFGAWVVADPDSEALGVWDPTQSQHYGEVSRWEFHTGMLRNGTKGAVMHKLSLLGLTGVVASGSGISTAHTEDGVNYSMERYVSSGEAGERKKRIEWRKLGNWHGYRIQRFRGDSGSRLAVLSVDAEISPLRY